MDAPAIEGMKNLYELAMGLRADFRRVEDSYREADRTLRETIISQQQNRGQVLDSLLDSHDALLQSPEGQVFHGFYEQLQGGGGLTEMAARLKEIRTHPLAASAFNDQQRSDLHWLIPLLVRESRQVMDARARSESDVRSFMQTGLAAEHHRVGQLVQQVLHAALGLDWSRQALRRTPADVPPMAVAFAQGNHQIKPPIGWFTAPPPTHRNPRCALTSRRRIWTTWTTPSGLRLTRWMKPNCLKKPPPCWPITRVACTGPLWCARCRPSTTCKRWPCGSMPRCTAAPMRTPPRA